MSRETPIDPSRLDAEVEAAVAAHRDGRLAEAEAAYRAVLQVDPTRARAAHNLGGLLLKGGVREEALRWLAAAVEAEPAGPWRPSYIRALVAEGRFEAAQDMLAAMADRPAGLEFELRQRWAFALVEQREYDQAEAQLLLAEATAPDEARFRADLGFVRLLQERPEAARLDLERSLELSPDSPDVLANLGTVMRKLGRPEEAETLYRRALALDPQNRGAALNLKTLRKTGGAAAEPLGEALMDYLAASDHDRAPDTLARIGSNLGRLGRRGEALKMLDDAVSIDPDRADARYFRAFVRLADGDFPGGWDDYEIRLRAPSFTGSGIGPEMKARLAFAPTRVDLKDRDILLVSEQGVGDEIMFASMIPDLAADAGKIACLCERRLVRLFANSFPSVTFSAEATHPERPAVAMGSLGRLYRQDLADFPGTPYLAPRAEVTARWAARLGPPQDGLRIGVSWRGGLKQTRTEQRSLSLEALKPLLDLPGCEFVSLQYGDVAAEVAAANEGSANPIRVFPRAEIDDFEELAGLVLNLDVIVSVQTALVHLAGALGAPCLAMVPNLAEWRYGSAGPSMPWYRSVELYRQPAPGAWNDVIARVRAALERRRP